MARMRYVVTGGTGFIGRRVVSRILARSRDAEVWVLVRRESLTRFERLAPGRPPGGAGESRWSATSPRTISASPTTPSPSSAPSITWCTAPRSTTSPPTRTPSGPRTWRAPARSSPWPVGSTRRCTTCRRSRWPGTYRGEYTEDDFDVAQDLPTPYHQTKFEAELLVRSEPGLRYRIYRPAVVVGDSRTGEMDKVDGPYYFFGMLAKLAMLPSVHPDPAARHRPHQHRSGRLRRRRAVRADARRRSRRPDVPPHRAAKPSGCAASTAGSPRRPACRGCAVRCRGVPRRRSCERPGAPRCCAIWRRRSWAFPPRSSTSST